MLQAQNFCYALSAGAMIEVQSRSCEDRSYKEILGAAGTEQGLEMGFCKQLLAFILRDHPLLRVCLALWALGPLRAVQNTHEKWTSPIRAAGIPVAIIFIALIWCAIVELLGPDVGIGVNVSDKCSRRSQPANELQFEGVEHELWCWSGVCTDCLSGWFSPQLSWSPPPQPSGVK